MGLTQSWGVGRRKVSDGTTFRSFSTQRSRSKSESSRPFSQSTVHQSTAEADNKRRPGISRRISIRYRPPSPEPPDPNSEAKSQTIRRMQSSLETWDKQLEEILHKKAHNDMVTKTELEKRDQQLEELTVRYNRECVKRQHTELERDNVTTELNNTTEELDDTKNQVKQLQSSLEQYQRAYQEFDENKRELVSKEVLYCIIASRYSIINNVIVAMQEEDLEEVSEQLQKSEGMRRRLNDHVTELQGQLAIEEQRSRFCTIL
jgi:myosin heavy subunit